MDVLLGKHDNLVAPLKSLADQLVKEQGAQVQGGGVAKVLGRNPFAHLVELQEDVVLGHCVVVQTAPVGEEVRGDGQQAGPDQGFPVTSDLDIQVDTRKDELVHPLFWPHPPTSMSGFHFSSPVDPQAHTMVLPFAPSPVTLLSAYLLSAPRGLWGDGARLTGDASAMFGLDCGGRGS